MENDFWIKKINAKGEVEFRNKEINAMKTQLVVTTGPNLIQHRMQKNSKLNKTEPCARHNCTQNSKRRGYSMESGHF